MVCYCQSIDSFQIFWQYIVGKKWTKPFYQKSHKTHFGIKSAKSIILWLNTTFSVTQCVQGWQIPKMFFMHSSYIILSIVKRNIWILRTKNNFEVSFISFWDILNWTKYFFYLYFKTLNYEKIGIIKLP